MYVYVYVYIYANVVASIVMFCLSTFFSTYGSQTSSKSRVGCLSQIHHQPAVRMEPSTKDTCKADVSQTSAFTPKKTSAIS